MLFISPYSGAGYLSDDLAIARERFEVSAIVVNQLAAPKKVTLLWRVFIELCTTPVDAVWIYVAVANYAVFVVWLAKRFGKKVFVITGGPEITFVPELNWGDMGSAWKRTAQRLALSQSDVILTYSEASRRDVERYTSVTHARTLYFGVDTERFKPDEGIEKENVIVTVAATVAQYSLVVKGVQTLLAAAAAMPDVRFVIIGRIAEDALPVVAAAPPNVHFAGRVSDSELLRWYQRAKVYAQVSAHEGFGVANIEAMACGCASVVSDVGSLPEVVGEAGLLVPFNDVAATVAACREALHRDDLRLAARVRIVTHFRLEQRRARLLATLRLLLEGAPAREAKAV